MDFGAFINIFGFNDANTSEGSLQSIFDAFDYNHQGFFGCEEFYKVANSVGENLSGAEVDQTIEYADKDRDGVINF